MEREKASVGLHTIRPCYNKKIKSKTKESVWAIYKKMLKHQNYIKNPKI